MRTAPDTSRKKTSQASPWENISAPCGTFSTVPAATPLTEAQREMVDLIRASGQALSQFHGERRAAIRRRTAIRMTPSAFSPGWSRCSSQLQDPQV